MVPVGQQASWDLLERLLADAATSGMLVLVVSTSPDLLETAQAQADRYGTHRYLGRPFDPNELRAAIADMIRGD